MNNVALGFRSFRHHQSLNRSGGSTAVDTQHPAESQNGQAKCHIDAVLDQVHLGTIDLVPINRYLGDSNTGRDTNHCAVNSDHRGRRSGLGKHQHLNVKDPAFRVHVRDNVRQGSAREELEAALRIANARGRRGCQDLNDGVEGLHQEVAQGGALDHRLTADQVATAANGNAAVASIDNIFAALDEVAQVGEARGAVRIRKDDVGTTHMAEAVGHGPALAAVLG